MNYFSNFSNFVTRVAGSPWAFLAALFVVVLGPGLGWNVDRIATITAFLMSFVILHSQNKDTKAIHIKINELIKSGEARNEIAGIEKLTDKEIKQLEP